MSGDSAVSNSNTENMKSRQVSFFLLVARGPGIFLTLPASKDAVSPSNLILSYPIILMGWYLNPIYLSTFFTILDSTYAPLNIPFIH